MERMDASKNDRILFLYSRLLQGQKLRKGEIAEEFGISEKSVQRDIEDIRGFLDRKSMEEGAGNRLVYDRQGKAYHLERN